MPTRPTLIALARRLGVSKASVSKALSPYPDRCDLAPATAERIRAGARAAGYAPEPRRAARARTASRNIGLVCQRAAPFSDGVYAGLLDGLGEALAMAGRRLVFAPAMDPAEWTRLLIDQRLDGAVLMELADEALAHAVARGGFPAVLINQRTTAPMLQVMPDEEHAADIALSLLADLGHRRVAFLRSPGRRAHPSVIERQDAFRRQCLIHHLTGTIALREPAPFLAAWLMAAPADRPTAVVCYNQSDAIELVAQAFSAGLVIPTQLSVVSLDDGPLLPWLRPAITAVTVPMREMAVTALTRLLAMIAGEQRPTADVLRQPGALARRATHGPPP